MASGDLQLQPREFTCTYHDSCYLGRYNDIYSAPRSLIKAAGGSILEMEKCLNQSFCCGAGGGRILAEETIGERINNTRVKMAEKTGTETLLSNCPFCLTMFADATALRAFFRADPDVILIGDMQDLQTAIMAVDAALNGHLLLSSVPVNSSAEGIIHCLNMGLDPLHLAAVLRGVLAQRLVRILCEHCKEPYYPEKAEYDRLLENYGISFFDHINVMYSDDLVFYRANGCSRCNETGYRGKKGLYELLVVNSAIRKLIMKRAPLGKIIEEAMLNDMILLSQEGIQLIFQGTMDCKELMSVSSL